MSQLNSIRNLIKNNQQRLEMLNKLNIQAVTISYPVRHTKWAAHQLAIYVPHQTKNKKLVWKYNGHIGKHYYSFNKAINIAKEFATSNKILFIYELRNNAEIFK